MKTIMIQVAERQWTFQALHLACAMARNTSAQIVLVRMIYVQHPGWLGTDMVETAPCDQEQQDLCQYAEIAEDYGVELSLRHMHYVSLVGALVDAAKALDADAVFASLPVMPFFHKVQHWLLERQLKAQHRQLYTLDQPANTEPWTPAVVVHGTK